MEYQYYNILEPGLYEKSSVKTENDISILPILIIAIGIIVAGYLYYQYRIDRMDHVEEAL